MHLPRGVDATRAVYDATAGAYVEAIGTRLDPAFEGPIERSLLLGFLELASRSDRPVADLGCGPGRVAAFLAERGVGTLGLDLALSMPPAWLTPRTPASASEPPTSRSCPSPP